MADTGGRSSDRIPVRVVVVGDELATVAAALRKADETIEIRQVQTPAAAGERCRRGDFDCVVVSETSADGVEVDDSWTADAEAFENLRAVRKLVDEPVVVVTDENEPAFVKQALEAGAADVIGVGPERSLLMARRLRHTAGKGEPFQTPEKRLESLLEHLPHQVFIKDDEGRIADVSQVTADEYGLTRSQMTGLTDFELFEPELAAELAAEERRLMETGDPIVNKAEHFVDRAGRDRWVSTSKAARYDEVGDVVGVLGTVRDVTEEKRQERMMEVLHEASRDLVSAESSAEIAAIAADIAADVPDLPRLCVALADGDELVPESGDEAVFATHREVFRQAFVDERTHLLAADGERLGCDEEPLEFDNAVDGGPVVAVLALGDHGVLGFASTSGNLDEFSLDLATVLAANAEVALDRAERERHLREQNERLEEFASLVSHDLRNPMSTAAGYLEAYRESGEPSHADEVEDALDRMGRLTEDMLELARHGRLVDDEELAPVDLQRAVETAWTGVGTNEASIEIDTTAALVCDRERLVEALENLFRNAVEHAGPDANVAVERTATGFAVEDDGPGIADAEKNSVFELGYTNAADGTGYGLYVVAQIARAHGWTVSVVDGVTGGDRFEFASVAFRS